MKTLILLIAMAFSGSSMAQSFGYTGKKNSSFSLMLGVSKTKLEVERDEDSGLTKIYTAHEFDYGLEYRKYMTRSFHMGVAATRQQNGYLTIGWDW